MTTPASTLRVRISADLADIKSGLGLLRAELGKVKREAAESINPNTAKFSQGISAVRGQLIGLAGAFVSLNAAGAGIRALFDAFDRADRIGEVARIAGISTEALSRLAFGAKFSGVQLDQLQVGLSVFNRELVKNSGLVSALGVEVFNAGTQQFRPTEQIILDLADVFASLPDGPERAALALKLFGRSGGELIPVLVEGRAKLEEFGTQADATGNTISESAAAAAGKFTDNLDVLKGSLTGVANETAARLIPSIAGYAEGAALAGQNSGVAAQAGELLANVFKVLAAGAVIVKNTVEAATNVVAFLGETGVGVATLLNGSLAKALGALAGSYKALLSGENPLTIAQAFRTSLAGVATDAKAQLRSIRAGYSAMSTGLKDAAADVSQIGQLFSAAGASAAAGTQGVAKAADQVKPATAAALGTLRKLLNGEGAGGGSGKDSAAAAKLRELRAEAERLERESEAAAEKITQDLLARDVRIEDGLLEARMAELNATGRTAEASFLQIDERWRSLLADLVATGNQAGAELVRKVINLEKLDAQLSEFKARAATITSNLSNEETSLSAQASASFIGSTEAETRIKDVRSQSLAQLRELRAAVVSYYEATKDPSVLAYLQQLDGSIAQVATSQKVFRQQIEDLAVSSVGNAFSDLVTGAQDFKDSFQQLVRSFVQGVAQMIAQALALRAVKATLGLFGGGAGASFAAAHSGGIVGKLSMIRHNINPLVFGKAPTYHEGGVAGMTGLKNREVAAILEEGETIRTKSQEAALARRMDAGRGEGGLVTTPIVAIGDAAVADAMASAAGERVVLTIVRNNWSGLSRGNA